MVDDPARNEDNPVLELRSGIFQKPAANRLLPGCGRPFPKKSSE
jgi:hypothetical protein